MMLLHATRQFNATQKGQVSITEDNVLLLVSDTHWYWWFVRDVDSGAEGFVPAEILELPSERQARLNRQCNITLPFDPLMSQARNSRPKKSVRFSDPLWESDQDDTETETEDEQAPISPTSPDECDSDIIIENVSLGKGVSGVEPSIFPKPHNVNEELNRIRIHGVFDDLSERLTAQAL